MINAPKQGAADDIEIKSEMLNLFAMPAEQELACKIELFIYISKNISSFLEKKDEIVILICKILQQPRSTPISEENLKLIVEGIDALDPHFHLWKNKDLIETIGRFSTEKLVELVKSKITVRDIYFNVYNMEQRAPLLHKAVLEKPDDPKSVAGYCIPLTDQEIKTISSNLKTYEPGHEKIKNFLSQYLQHQKNNIDALDNFFEQFNMLTTTENEELLLDNPPKTLIHSNLSQTSSQEKSMVIDQTKMQTRKLSI